MLMYEVDLRDRKTGNSVECVLSTPNHDEAWKFAKEWNEKNIADLNVELSYDSYIDGTEGLVADVYEVEKHHVRGVGRFDKNDKDDLSVYDVCVYGYIYTIEAQNENEAKLIACDEYFEDTGLQAYTDDEAVVWKIHEEYPYEWR